MSKEFNEVSVSGGKVSTVEDHKPVDDHTVENQMSMKQKPKPFTLSYSSQFQNRRNTSYPFTTTVTSSDDLKKLTRFDHVAAVFNDGINTQGNTVRGYRNKKCFQSSDVVIMDCDNTVSDPLSPDIPDSRWKTPSDVEKAFPDVQFYIVYSRNHMRVKDGRAARPKFHVYFPLGRPITDAGMYQKLKAAVQEQFEWFDANALSITQFMFGVENPTVEYFPGSITVDEFIGFPGSTDTVEKRNRKDRKSRESRKSREARDNQKLLDKWMPAVVEVGHRSNTLSHFAGRVLKRFGESDRARELFNLAADRCIEPMEAEELDSIWRSARDFYNHTVRLEPGYVEPGEYDDPDFDDLDNLDTADSSDDGEEDDLDSGEDGGTEDTGNSRRIITTDTIRKVLHKMGITIRLNDLTGMAEITGMPEGYSKTNAANVLPVLISDYMKEHRMRTNRQAIDDCLMAIMDRNRFNPVKEMLSNTVWDGVDRVTELMEIMGIASPSDTSPTPSITTSPASSGSASPGTQVSTADGDNSSETSVDDWFDWNHSSIGNPSGGEAADDTDGLPTVDDHSGGRTDADDHSDGGSGAEVAPQTLEQTYLIKWLHQCVALAFNDEEDPYGADGVLVIQDEQGAGKTLLCSTLAVYSDWFAEGVSIDLNNKDSIIQSTGCWIAEMGELDSTLKREQSALKAFLTSKTDTFRLPYARTSVKKPRHTSFCATVNPKEFLNDETGSRRFWVIHPCSRHPLGDDNNASTTVLDKAPLASTGSKSSTTADEKGLSAQLDQKTSTEAETGVPKTSNHARSSINVPRLLQIHNDPEKYWAKQLWRQVYETMFLKNPQGFRLTREEQKMLQVSNREYEKPIAGEIEILDFLDFEADVTKWKWSKASDLTNGMGLRTVSPVQAGRVLAKLAKSDPRIKIRQKHNVKSYFLPPSVKQKFYPSYEDTAPVLQFPGAW